MLPEKNEKIENLPQNKPEIHLILRSWFWEQFNRSLDLSDRSIVTSENLLSYQNRYFDQKIWFNWNFLGEKFWNLFKILEFQLKIYFFIREIYCFIIDARACSEKLNCYRKNSKIILKISSEKYIIRSQKCYQQNLEYYQKEITTVIFMVA